MVGLVRKASLGGAKRRSMTQWEWDVAGNCQRPAVREFWSRPSADDPRFDDDFRRRRQAFAVSEAVKVFVGDHTWEPPPKRRPGRRKTIVVAAGRAQGLLVVEMHVRCRTCETCRKVRSRMWYARAMTETIASARTWFGTITLRPQANHESLSRARRQCTRRGVVWEELTPDEQFAELHKQNGLHLQLWLKRVRKESGAPLRFLLVCEAHKSGLPHYHCLLHETDAMRPVRHKTLSDQWKLGFTNFKLCVDPRQAGYLCKYLSKSAAARVRASARYGQSRPDDIAKRDLVFASERRKTPTQNETPPLVAVTTQQGARAMGGEILERGDDNALS